MAYETLEIENHGAVRRILLAREAQRNAQSKLMLDELMAAFDEARVDDSVNVVVLGGKGAHFSAGHDLKQAQAERSNFTVEERWAYEELRYFDYSLKIWDFPKPTIAQVQGEPAVLERWRAALPLPLRVEEETFLYESLYRQFRKAG